jgi:hypothetical protein
VPSCGICMVQVGSDVGVCVCVCACGVCVAGEFRDIASIAVQKGATELKGLVDGAVHTVGTLRSQKKNSLDTPFIAVPGVPRRRPSPAGALNAAVSELMTVQGFLHEIVEEKILGGLEVVRVSFGLLWTPSPQKWELL